MSESATISYSQGRVLVPEHEDFDTHTRGWNLSHKHEPSIVFLPETEQDIILAIKHASENHLPISVQCTGHSVPKLANDAVLIRTEHLQGIQIYPSQKTTTAGCGVKTGQLIEVAHQHNLMPLTGSSMTIGVIGYLLGGGFPLLAREFGLASDYVTRYRIALSNGEIIDTTESEHPDLFWALQGGGGAFGIVLEAEVKLFEDHMMHGGNATFPFDRVDELFRNWFDHVNEIPESMSTSMSIMHMPQMPHIPEPLRGKSLLFYTACSKNSQSEFEIHTNWAKNAQPIMANFGEMPCVESGKICRDPIEPVPARGGGVLLGKLDHTAITTLIDSLRPSDGPPWYLKAEVRKLGGAIQKHKSQSPLTLQRDAEYLLYIVGPVHPGNSVDRINQGLDSVYAKGL
jgi:hypothetical protein